MVGPLYVSETAPAHIRGALVSIVQLTITIGILASYLAGALWTGTGDWKSMLLVGAVPGFVMLLVAAAVPESPRWYLLQGRVADAERAHRRLTGGTGDPVPAQEAGAGDTNWRDLFAGRNFMVLVLATVGPVRGVRQSERHRCDTLLCADDLRRSGLRRDTWTDPGDGRHWHHQRARHHRRRWR